jgi:hypothetical protein
MAQSKDPLQVRATNAFKRSSHLRSKQLRGIHPDPPKRQCTHLTNLLFEEIIKRRSRTRRTQASRSRSFFLSRHAYLIRRAFVAHIFLGDTFFHRLHALKPAPWIEICALFAGMQRGPALWASLAGRSLQHRAALRAARHCPRAGQIHRARTKRMVPLRWTALALGRRLPRFLARLLV